MSSVQLTTIESFKEFVIESVSQNFKEQLSFLDKIPEKEFEKNYFEEDIKGQLSNLKRKKLDENENKVEIVSDYEELMSISQEPITPSKSPLPSSPVLSLPPVSHSSSSPSSSPSPSPSSSSSSLSSPSPPSSSSPSLATSATTTILTTATATTITTTTTLKPQLQLPQKRIRFTTSQFSPYYETTNNNDNDSNDNSDNNKSTYSIEAISRAKNTIAFFRALNSGYFRNLDPNSFVVISDGKLLGIYPNEDQAEAMIRKAIASRSNFSITNLHRNDENNNDHLLHDAMIMMFPISGNFKKKPSNLYINFNDVRHNDSNSNSNSSTK